MAVPAPFDVDPVIAHLRTQVNGLRDVAGSADFATAVASTSPVVPAAYVLLASERANASAGAAGIAVQSIQVRFAVVVACRSYRVAERGMNASAELRDLVGQVRSNLLGRTPPGFTAGQAQSVDLVSGALLSYSSATLWWQEIYSTTYWSRT